MRTKIIKQGKWRKIVCLKCGGGGTIGNKTCIQCNGVGHLKAMYGHEIKIIKEK